MPLIDATIRNLKPPRQAVQGVWLRRTAPSGQVDGFGPVAPEVPHWWEREVARH